MLNALGYSEEGFDEGSEGLRTKRTNNLSVEGGVGLFLKKNVKMEKYGKLGFKIGGVYYHEFATPYDKIQAQHNGSNAGLWYEISDYANLYQRDRAVLEAAIDFFDLGVKYKF